MSVIQTAYQQLLDGVPGDQVKAQMRQTYKTLGSLNTTMSHVRKLIKDGNHRHPTFAEQCKTLEPFKGEGGVPEFLTATLTHQLDIQKQHRIHGGWSTRAEVALSQLKILPDNLQSFALTHSESLTLKQHHEAAQIKKNQHPVTIKEAGALLKHARWLLQTAKPHMSFPRLVLPLSVVSGRRECELLNGHSTFAPSPHGATYTVFSGAAKKRGKDDTYTIPLLVEYDLYKHALDILREKQRGEGVTTLENEGVTSRYQSNLERDLGKVLPALAPNGKRILSVHGLRSLYMAYISVGYASPFTFAATAMEVLGHLTLFESHSYANVRLEGCDEIQGAFGPLVFDDNDE